MGIGDASSIKGILKEENVGVLCIDPLEQIEVFGSPVEEVVADGDDDLRGEGLCFFDTVLEEWVVIAAEIDDGRYFPRLQRHAQAPYETSPGGKPCGRCQTALHSQCAHRNQWPSE